MIYNRQNLPLINISKVKISRNPELNFNIDFNLSERSVQSIEDYKKTYEDLTGANIVFLILTTKTEDFLPGLQNVRTRHLALTEFINTNKKFVKEVPIAEVIKNGQTLKKEYVKKSIEKLLFTAGTQTFSINNLSEKEESEIKNVHLLSFIQLKNTSSDLETYIMTDGSDIQYELLLTQTANGLLPPAKRNAFFAKSNIDPNRSLPYNGPAHYHTSENPGPNGYVGWMAGHNPGQMGQELLVREIDNYKVVSDDLISQKKESKPIVEIPKSFSSSAVGTGLIKHDFKKSNTLSKAEITASLLKASKTVLEKNKKSFFYSLGDKTMSIISSIPTNQQSSYSKSKYNNCYMSVFGVDFMSLLRYRSKHGPLINYHYENGNLGIINQALNISEIKNIKISRTRISNRPDRKNKLGTFEHTNFSKNSKIKNIVTSIDVENLNRLKNKLKTFRTLDGEIREISLSAMTPSGLVFEHPECKYMRQFIFKDFDLFHNQTEGVYTYEVKIEIIDGMDRILKNKQKTLNNLIIEFKKYLEKQTVKIKKQSYESKVKRSKKNNKESNVNIENRNFIKSAVETYYETSLILSGKSVNLEKKNSLINNLTSINLDTSLISKFLTNLESLSKLFESKAGLHNEKKMKKFSSSNLTGAIPGNIVEIFKTGIKAKAFSETQLLINYLPGLGSNLVIPGSNLSLSLKKILSLSYEDAYNPAEVLTISGQKYQNKDFLGSAKIVEKKLSELTANKVISPKDLEVRNPIEKSNLKIKLAVLSHKDSKRKSKIAKDPISYTNEIQQLGSGMKIKVKGKGLFKEKKLTDLDKDFDGQSTPVLAEEVQKAIINVSKNIFIQLTFFVLSEDCLRLC